MEQDGNVCFNLAEHVEAKKSGTIVRIRKQ